MLGKKIVFHFIKTDNGPLNHQTQCHHAITHFQQSNNLHQHLSSDLTKDLFLRTNLIRFVKLKIGGAIGVLLILSILSVLYRYKNMEKNLVSSGIIIRFSNQSWCKHFLPGRGMFIRIITQETERWHFLSWKTLAWRSVKVVNRRVVLFLTFSNLGYSEIRMFAWH